MEEMPYRTKILSGKIDLGYKGIRIFGLLWLALALVFFSWSAIVLLDQTWWYNAGFYSILASLILCILAWPDAKTGIVTNLLLIIILTITTTDCLNQVFN